MKYIANNKFRWLLCIIFSIALLTSCSEHERLESNRLNENFFDLSVEESYRFSLSASFEYFDSIQGGRPVGMQDIFENGFKNKHSIIIEWTPLVSDIIKMEVDTVFSFDTIPIIRENQIHGWKTNKATITTSAKIIAKKKGEVTITAKIGNQRMRTWRVNVEGDTDEVGVEINGIIWATRNVNTSGFFVANPQRYGLYYQWNDSTGWSVTSAENGWNGSWSSNDTIWQKTSDPCPKGWRIPTHAELKALIEVSSRWETRKDTIKSQNVIIDVNGRVFSHKKNTLFLPAAGYLREQETLKNQRKETVFFEGNLSGAYWGHSTRVDTIINERIVNDTTVVSDTTYRNFPYPYCFSFGSGNPQVGDNFPFIGFSCRCVKE